MEVLKIIDNPFSGDSGASESTSRADQSTELRVSYTAREKLTILTQQLLFDSGATRTISFCKERSWYRTGEGEYASDVDVPIDPVDFNGDMLRTIDVSSVDYVEVVDRDMVSEYVTRAEWVDLDEFKSLKDDSESLNVTIEDVRVS